MKQTIRIRVHMHLQSISAFPTTAWPYHVSVFFRLSVSEWCSTHPSYAIIQVRKTFLAHTFARSLQRLIERLVHPIAVLLWIPLKFYVV